MSVVQIQKSKHALFSAHYFGTLTLLRRGFPSSLAVNRTNQDAMDQEFLSAVVKSPSLIRPFADNQHRQLEDVNGGQGSYLVDASGNPYEPYALSWRYLGMYIDCDVVSSGVMMDDDTQNQINRRRHLESGDSDDVCSRKVLWAAVSSVFLKLSSAAQYLLSFYSTTIHDTEGIRLVSTNSTISNKRVGQVHLSEVSLCQTELPRALEWIPTYWGV